MPEFKNDKAVIIMNHKTRLDWLYYWSVVLRHGKLENEKIILKNGLKHIPGPGDRLFILYRGRESFHMMKNCQTWLEPIVAWNILNVVHKTTARDPIIWLSGLVPSSGW